MVIGNDPVSQSQLLKSITSADFRNAGNSQLHKNTEMEQESKNAFKGIDGLELSPKAEASLNYAQAQFSVNYQAIRSLSGPEGTYSQQIDFSFNASFEFLQLASGGEPVSTENLDSTSLIDKLQEIFSPENTAQRIIDFALAQYAPAGEGGQDDRQNFSDFIGDAVQKGFDAAAGILGSLQNDIQEGIDKTHQLVFGGLADFVKNGLPEDSEKRSQSIREYAKSFQASVRLQYSSVTSSSYNYRGQAANPENETNGELDAEG